MILSVHETTTLYNIRVLLNVENTLSIFDNNSMRSAIKRKALWKSEHHKIGTWYVVVLYVQKTKQNVQKEHKNIQNIKWSFCMMNKKKGEMIYVELMKCNMSEMNNYL